MSDREPRDQRGPDDPRDQRDPRLEDDPRDERDVRRPGDAHNGNSWTRPGAAKLTALIVVLFLVDFFWSTHTKDVAVRTAQHTQQVALAQAQHTQQVALAQVEKALVASCDFIKPLTGLPITVSPVTGKASILSVQIVAGAREQYAGQCVGHDRPPLPPPDPSLTRWARYFHIPVAA